MWSRSGGFLQTILIHYLSINIPWQLLTLLLTLGALWLIVGGAKPSTLIADGIVAVALIYGGVMHRRDHTLGERVGSVVADAD